MNSHKPNSVIPVIVFSQFACASMWFAGNAIIKSLIDTFSLSADSLGHLTSAVQFGFITGTLTFAILTISDRFSPSKVFFACALAGAASNLLTIIPSQTIVSLLLIRFFTGFFLAGIYPVGMKISSDYFEKGLGKALGFLVGALVLGTALPHLLNYSVGSLNWKYVIYASSGLSVLGGLAIFLFVPDGPYRKPSQHLDLSAFYRIFRNKGVRAAAFGYFGHMWELYTFWAFIPLTLAAYSMLQGTELTRRPLLAFIIIAVGCIACIIGGYISQKIGSKKTAFTALMLSGICCLISPLMFYIPMEFFLAYLFFWGMAVVADSPQFSTLVATNAPEEFKGTALTIVNCIGFAITIVSIEVFNLVSGYIEPDYRLLILAPGPVLGLIAMYRLKG